MYNWRKGIALLGPKGELPVEDEWAGKVLALINEERCEWTLKSKMGDICVTGCTQTLMWNTDIKDEPYCPCCGRKIEVKG